MYIDTIERIAKTGRVLLKGDGKIILSSPGDVSIKPSTKDSDAFVLSNSAILENFSKGLEIKYSKIISLIDDGNPVAIPGTVNDLIQLLSEDFFLATNPKIESNETRIENIETQRLKVTNFEIISTTTGSITKPTGATLLMDQFEGVVDAIVSEIGINNTPTWISPRDASDNIISVSSFNTDGDYVLTSTPVGNIAIIYVYSVARIDFDYTKSIGFETLDISRHEELGNLQGGTTGEHYHLTQAEQEDLTLYFDEGFSFIDVETAYYRRNENFKINTIENPDALTVTIEVNGVAYSLGDPINAYDEVTIDVDAVGFIVLNCESI